MTTLCYADATRPQPKDDARPLPARDAPITDYTPLVTPRIFGERLLVTKYRRL